MVIDGLDKATIDNLLDDEIEATRLRHIQGQQILLTMAKLSPVVAIVGALLFLIRMFASPVPANWSSPILISPLIYLLYGVCLGVFVFIPLAERLKLLMNEELTLMEMIREGILGIKQQEFPRNLEARLNIFIPVKERIRVEINAEKTV